MSGTTLEVTLSTTLANELDHPGVSVYSVYYDNNGDTAWTSIINNGTVAGTSTTNETLTSPVTVGITLPDPMPGGKVYFIIQSDSLVGGEIPNLETVITSQSDINWNNGSLYDFRYDSFEVTLSGAGADVGNLTSVNGFGLPMEVTVPYTNVSIAKNDGTVTNTVTSQTTSTVGYNIDGNAVAQGISAISTIADYNFTAGPLQGQFREAVSPTTAVGQADSLWPGSIAAFSTLDWQGYVQSMTAVAGVEISGVFNGAKDAGGTYHNGGYFSYDLSYDGTIDASQGGAFILTPGTNSQIKGTIVISADDLENSIYSTNGTMEILQNGSVFTTENTGWNDQWGKVMSEFLVGFTGGYYESTGISANPQLAGTTIDLNQNLNWDPTYAFGTIASLGSIQTNDPYAKLFFQDTNSYGAGYSDALMAAYSAGGPQISVAQGITNYVTTNGTISISTTAADVPTIDLTIFADGETPAGYTPAVIYNYISAAAGGSANLDNEYNPATTIVSGNNVNFNFAVNASNTVGMVLDKDETIVIKVLKSDTGGVPIWNSITLDGATAGTAGLWQNWTITGDTADGYTATASEANQPPGSLLLVGMPTAEDGVSWYQIVVGTGANARTFNLYTTTSGGEFENPINTTGTAAFTQAGALAIDGLAQITVPAQTVPPASTIQTFTIGFGLGAGSAVTVDQSLLDINTGNATLPTPDAPVAGIFSGGSFVALAGQTLQVSNTITTTDDRIAFGWTGLNNSTPNTVSWISGYTNKIDADEVVQVSIVSTDTAITMTATSNIDGSWVTDTSPVLNPGTYTVTMKELVNGDTATPGTATSTPLVLDVEPVCFVTGTTIRTPSGDVPVENLAVGDLIMSQRGEAQAITWIGKGQVLATRGRRSAATPVIVREGALADNVPDRDLYVTKGHSLYLDGVLIPAEFLVNHRSILWDDRAQEVEFYHIELAQHDVLLANGAPAESYRDDGNRWLFRNANTGWDQPAKPACAPVLTGGPEVDTVWHKLLDRSGSRLDIPTTGEPDLHILVDGVRVDGRAVGNGVQAFRLTAAPTSLRIVSRAAAQDELGLARDPRKLGVALRQVMLWQGAQVRMLAADDERLCDGFHAFETDNAFRWTNGNAALPAELFDGVDGVCELELHIASTTHYPLNGGRDRVAA